MKKIPNIDINSIDFSDKDLILHLSKKSYEPSIDENGLIPQIGENSKGDLGNEKTAKVFFTKSIDGTLMYLNRTACIFSDIVDQNEVENYSKGVYSYFSDVYNKCMQNDDIKGDKKKISFELMKEYLNKAIFFKCNINKSTKDEYEKMSEEQKNNVDYLLDDLNEERGTVHAINNMHTISGKGISKDKLQKITVDGKDSALNVFKVLMEKYKKLNPDKPIPTAVHPNKSHDENLLDDFYNYSFKTKEKTEPDEKSNFLSALKENVNTDSEKYITEGNEDKDISIQKNEKNKQLEI